MGFDDQWLDNGFDPEDIAAEIECHFERLLSRGNLRVRVLTGAAVPPSAASAGAAGQGAGGEVNVGGWRVQGRLLPRPGPAGRAAS